LIEQLEQLCAAAGFVREADARQVIEGVNRQLLNLLKADAVALYWSQAGERGYVLTPVAHINFTERPDPQPFIVNADSREVLAWVFLNAQPLWLEDVARRHRDDVILNRATGARLTRGMVNLDDPPLFDSIVAVPLLEKGGVHGVYAVDTGSRQLSQRVVALMQRLGRPLASLLHSADMLEYQQRQTGRAVRLFLDSIRDFRLSDVLLDQDFRTAFIATPYSYEFDAVRQSLAQSLAASGVRTASYVPETRQYVVSEITAQIRNSHFCIADLTGNNVNVITEVGMMMVLGKRTLVLRRRGDDTSIPFDLSHFSVWEYEIDQSGTELLVFSPADNRLVPFRGILERFLAQLPGETGFMLAEPWQAPADEVATINDA
jgi:hypothetical protein